MQVTTRTYGRGGNYEVWKIDGDKKEMVSGGHENTAQAVKWINQNGKEGIEYAVVAVRLTMTITER